MDVYVRGLKSGLSSSTYAYWTSVAEGHVLNEQAVPGQTSPFCRVLLHASLLPPSVYVPSDQLLVLFRWTGLWRLTGRTHEFQKNTTTRLR